MPKPVLVSVENIDTDAIFNTYSGWTLTYWPLPSLYISANTLVQKNAGEWDGCLLP